VLTREHDVWEQACLRAYSARSRGKVLDEVSATISPATKSQGTTSMMGEAMSLSMLLLEAACI